ncbi:caspase family protein [Calothrix sp. 336/3]|uniref:caspase family protein n=1 Tax=Calothrix sp. 336/3 TaxID=1337936 RepID=UPI0005557C4A|nr:caspase family protein [Calothrix sp. 336/3]AKG20278.1 caspase [Calothrix sp. 336/3]
MANIYALLVGIDNYAAPVSPLRGCINDVKAIAEYLQTRVETTGWNLHLKVLQDEAATRQGIIDGFRQHLCQATSNDVALFYYSGHGSQEPAPREFWEFQPEKLNETLVCYDSRLPGGWDLADKELAKLIAEVGQKNPHITLILDCCHSGTGTRNPFQETAVREFTPDVRVRPLESFIFSQEEIQRLRAGEGKLNQQESGWSLPRGKHILFASCKNSETAKEYQVNGEHRGAFCYFLTETLKQIPGNLTYRDLFKRINASVRSQIKQQSPQLEATDSKELEQLFLGGSVGDRLPYYTVSHHKQYGWVIDGGAVHGVPRPQGGETMHLALFPITAQAENLRQLSQKLTEAQVVEVLPQLSQIAITGAINLDKEQTFKAVITSLPLPPKGVRFIGDSSGVQLLQQALKNIDNAQPSPYLREVGDNETAAFKVIARNGEYIITRPADGVSLVSEIPDYTPASATKVIQRLEHITRWQNLSELSSPANSRISADAIQLEIYHNNQVISDSQIQFNYYQDDSGKWKKPTFKIKLKNTSDETLYCALLNLTEKFAINAGFFEAGYVKLEPNQQVWAFGGKAIPAGVPDDVWQQGITEYQDILKLIVCTNEFDARLLEQDQLDLPRKKYTQRSARASTLNRLMSRWQSRDFILDESGDEEYDDWVATQIITKTIRPLETIHIPNSGNGVSLGTGVVLKPHPHFQGTARLTSISPSERSDNYYLPPLLRENSQPFDLTNTRGIEPNANALELTAVDAAAIATVTRENPLKLIVDTSLAPGENVLPLAYDGEFYLPLGVGYSHYGKTEIRLEQLPTPENLDNPDERSLKSAFKIYFQKVASTTLGFEFSYPQLSVAKVTANEKVNYETNFIAVKQEVAKAEKIVVFIHGIIGDTAGLIPGMHKAKVMFAGQEKPLGEMYDLILAFDYENLNTSIEDNARLLKQRLEAVGLGEGHGKELHIVAHSMGGLISRWFIEREGGNKIVNHLVMLGTPNGGSPWSTVQDWAMMLLTLGLNGISTVALPVKVLGTLLGSLETIDIALDQMKPGSEVLKSLATSPDPGIPYTIIAGNNSVNSVAGETKKIQQLMAKLQNKCIDLVFLSQVNDIAVTVSSITSVNNQRSPQPQIYEVTCNHLNYFSDRAGLTALTNALLASSTINQR